MTATSSEKSVNVEEEYLAGLLDYLIRPKLRPMKNQETFGLSAKVEIPVRRSPTIAGIIQESLWNYDIDTQVRYAAEAPKYLVISDNSDIEKLHDVVSGETIQSAEKLAYLVKYIDKYAGRIIAGQPELFLKIYHPWAKLHPHWQANSGRKYTLDYFKKEFGIPTPDETEIFPDVSYATSLNEKYVAGLFDAKGQIRLTASKSSMYDMGYSLIPAVGMHITRPNIRIKPNLMKFAEDKPYNLHCKHRNGRLNINITSADEISSFVDDIGRWTYYLYEICQFFSGQLLPAYQDGYHRESQDGFIDMLRAYEDVKPGKSARKYNSDHFENIWDVSLEQQ